MKPRLLVTIFLCLSGIIFSQEKPSDSNEGPFTYLELKEEFDLLVDFTMVNPECATKGKMSYSLIIGTTVVGDYIERISVLVPCLSNEFVQGDLISIQPIKTPKKNIVYAIRTYEVEGQEISEVFGTEFKAIWGEVSAVL